MTVDRAAAMLADVLAGPARLTELLEAYEATGGPLAALPETFRGRPRVVLVGLGSSRHAALDAATMLRAAGVAAWAEHASAGTPTPPGRDTILVAISASGRTSEALDAVDRHRGSSLVVAVTNDPSQPLATTADVVLPLFAGVEASGVSCRTFAATDAVLGLLAARLVPALSAVADVRAAIDGLARLLDGRHAWLPDVAELLDRSDAIGVVGGTAELGLAEQAALMLREGPRLPAVAHETGEWLHSAIYTALPGYRAVLLAGSSSDAALVRVIAGRGGSTVVVGGRAANTGATTTIEAGSGRAARLARSAVGDLLATELWARTRLADRNASDLALPTQG